MEEFLRATDLIERCGWPRWPHSRSDGGISYAWRMMFGWNRRRMHPGIIRSGKLGTARGSKDTLRWINWTGKVDEPRKRGECGGTTEEKGSASFSLWRHHFVAFAVLIRP